jgi:hypothetical protein
VLNIRESAVFHLITVSIFYVTGFPAGFGYSEIMFTGVFADPVYQSLLLDFTMNKII